MQTPLFSIGSSLVLASYTALAASPATPQTTPSPRAAAPPTASGSGSLGVYGVVAEVKVGSASGGFAGALSDTDAFGQGLASLGDLDGDGTLEVAVGAIGDDDGGVDRGAVWILSLADDGAVVSETKLSATAGGFGGALDDNDFFGNELAALGDLDGDGRQELAIAATLDDDGGVDRGAVWIVSLEPDGSAFASSKIADGVGGFTGVLGNFDSFGFGLAGLGDLDGDGVGDLAVGAPLADRGGTDRGAVWILFLEADGSVRASQELSSIAGGFAGALDDGDFFGRALTALGDLDGDGFQDLAIGAPQDDDGGTDRGAVWIVSLAPDGTVRTERKLSQVAGGFAGSLDDGAAFGVSLAFLGDTDGDGVAQLAVGANRLDRGGVDRGGVWVLSLATDGTVLAEQELSATAGGLTDAPDDTDRFGTELAVLPGLYGPFSLDLAVGAINDDTGGTNRGAVYHLALSPAASANVRNAGTNPLSLSAGAPELGELFQATVDLTGTTGHLLAGLYGYAGPLQVTLPKGQTLLIDITHPSGEILMQPFRAAPVAAFDIPVPADPGIAGQPLSIQAVHIGGVFPFALSNAIDVVVGI